LGKSTAAAKRSEDASRHLAAIAIVDGDSASTSTKKLAQNEIHVPVRDGGREARTQGGGSTRCSTAPTEDAASRAPMRAGAVELIL
jgi:hypothetical protein